MYKKGLVIFSFELNVKVNFMIDKGIMGKFEIKQHLI